MKKDVDKPLARSDNLFPVVGIGASAGGLEAFKRLLQAIPKDSGMAYVLVQHLDPNHESLLPELLQKVTKVPVLAISDDIRVLPNHIYIIPSNKTLVASDGILRLSPRPPNNRKERYLPIDLFFASLAEVHRAQSIGVVLSGTASDGTKGLKAIKDQGGITFAQDEESAAYEAMPQNAVQAGVVDFILPPEEIPRKLMEIKAQPQRNELEMQNSPLDADVFRQMLALLRVRKGTDFSYYKQTTIRRRILRRIALAKKEKPAIYLRYLQENVVEQDALYQDLLIPVTAFFRDPKIYAHLTALVFPEILKNKTAGEPIRVWVAGCSTGEEAYSMAISLHEFLGDYRERIQVFATDISEPAIAKARAGIYAKSTLEGIAPQRLQTFFTKINGHYQVIKQLRDMCVFANHDFLKDPPFSRIDFISCRNVLIYMEPYLQKRALTTFHYALNPKGILLLGKSETSGSVPDLFAAMDKHDKLFTRKDVPGRFLHVASPRNEQNLQDVILNPKRLNLQTDFQKTADDIMLSRYTPAGVVINEAMDIVHFRGRTGLYLEQAPGKPSHNLLKMAKNGLAFELRSVLHKAKKANGPVEKEHIPFLIEGTQHLIRIEAIPLPNVLEPHYLIVFHDQTLRSPKPFTSGPGQAHSLLKKDAGDLQVEQLERELAQSRENMRSITEDQEAANEELQSANEELLSGSEELQSLNEELETSKEELQSSNEELTTLTQGMISLNNLLTEARDYAEAIIATMHEPMLVIDQNLRVRSANQSFYKLFRVTEAKTEGVLLYELGNKQWNIPRLRDSLENIIAKNAHFKDFELTHTFPRIGEKIMLLNANRIVQKSQGEQLILLAINDITELRRKALELQIKEKALLKKDIEENKALKVILEIAVVERTKELQDVNLELAFQNGEKEKRAAELLIANKELAFQNGEKEKRAGELLIANEELNFQNVEKEKRAGELLIANEELNFQNEEKEKRAGELLIANEELNFQNEEKEKRAQELLIANKELQSFTFVSSHDLQEPLRKIQTFANLILEKEAGGLSEKGKRYFLRIQQSALRMQQLIIDLLDFSRISTAERNFEKTNLSVILAEVAHDFKEIMEEKQATLEITGVGEAELIPFQFRQLLQNLIGNALKFSSPLRPPFIKIHSTTAIGSQLNGDLLPGQKKLAPEKNYWHLSIADNGIGFDQGYQDQIFELFQRLHGKEAYAGTGIGLAIVKKIVENHHGIITATGAQDKGARFDIYLPELDTRP